MKRSEINRVKEEATLFFKNNGWALPPLPKWDITDFGLGDFNSSGLLLINLAEEEEYCEKLMYAAKNQLTPAHYHKRKKEDIICRAGTLAVQIWKNDPASSANKDEVEVKINGEKQNLKSGELLHLAAGERITLMPFVWHAFYPVSSQCIIGEVSTANDDNNDNFFSDPNVGRFSPVEEDQ